MRQAQKGFGVIEVIIGLLLLVIIFLVVAGVWKMSAESQNRSGEISQQQPENAPSIDTPKTDSSTKVADNPSTTVTNQTTNADTPHQSSNPTIEDNGVSSASTAVTYRISDGGGTAQVAPVITRLGQYQAVNLTVDLQCLSSCQFKLVSDTHPITSEIYSSSQKITYRLDRPGQHFFYNQFTPGVKFGVAFGE